jgi:DNA-binding CsgD family transcriptional regulator
MHGPPCIAREPPIAEAVVSANSRGRGGKGGHEPRSRIRLREVQVLEQILDGRRQHQIATALNISQPAVSKIARRLEERLLADVAFKVDRQRARQTLRLEFIYQESIGAWHASKQESLRRRQRKADGGDGGTIAEIVSENRDGDPRYLDEARRALADLRTIWGIDAPNRMSIEAATPYASMSDAALEAELARQARLLKTSQVTPVPVIVTAEDGGHDER